MLGKEFSRILPVAIASAVAALLLTAAGLPSLAQTIESGDSMSGTINSLVQENGETTHVIGGDWNLSLESNSLNEFSAEFVMTASDGTGSHTHRIVVADDLGSVQLEDEPSGNVQVTVTPTEQAAGGTVLVNATGLVASNVTTVKVGDIIAGTPDSDEEGNVLFALGVTEEMSGSQTVTVEDGTNIGSAAFTSTGTEISTESGNVTTTEPAGNLTTTEPTGNVTTTESTANVTTTEPTIPESPTPPEPSSDTGESIYGSVIEGQSYDTGMDVSAASEGAETSLVEDTTDTSAESELTTSGDMSALDNQTSDIADATSNQTGSTGPEADITASFEVVADIYTEDELKWEDVSVAVSIMNGQIISLEIDPAATENHFGDQPIFGMVSE